MNNKALPVTCVTHKANSIYKHSSSHKTKSGEMRHCFIMLYLYCQNLRNPGRDLLILFNNSFPPLIMSSERLIKSSEQVIMSSE